MAEVSTVTFLQPCVHEKVGGCLVEVPLVCRDPVGPSCFVGIALVTVSILSVRPTPSLRSAHGQIIEYISKYMLNISDVRLIDIR